MANCCSNWFNVEFDKEHLSFKEFIKKTNILRRADSISSRKGQLHSISKDTDGYFFDLQFGADNLEVDFGGGFCTNWSPIKTHILVELMEDFGCIKEIQVIYEEKGCAVGGVVLLERYDDGEINVNLKEAKSDYWNMVKMQEMAEDGYRDVAHCSEITGLSEENIINALRLCHVQLSHFTDTMECFDVEDFSD